ncbi:GNAT family protein [Paracoccus sp. TOH]|uniref:GNAT family N-acetyltransferase n=1 Tax=Paracoccus sp. TOH TaxID=1263728 RepID=UPI0025AFBB3D|nr:GNAT family protein [Paracoccus sp. TOH]WJS84513.1 GNAT family N-acetyltransferase [Paracoccus sp. TOH]
MSQDPAGNSSRPAAAPDRGGPAAGGQEIPLTGMAGRPARHGGGEAATPSARPTGPVIRDFAPPAAPGPERIEGGHVLLERLDPQHHAEDLFAANQGQDWVWDYLGYGPFADLAGYRAWQTGMAARTDPYFYALRERTTGRVGGLASFMRIDPAHGVIEIGHIEIAPPMQRTPAATEAISLMIGWAFGAGYRRVEWKCDALNAPSRRAALRYGFTRHSPSGLPLDFKIA